MQLSVFAEQFVPKLCKVATLDILDFFFFFYIYQIYFFKKNDYALHFISKW